MNRIRNVVVGPGPPGEVLCLRRSSLQHLARAGGDLVAEHLAAINEAGLT